ncbi:MAG: PQQ-binding-like beta-propeller repeat protein [candidate division WOR-3 bacterium]
MAVRKEKILIPFSFPLIIIFFTYPFVFAQPVLNLKKVPLFGDTTEEVLFTISTEKPETLVYEVFFGDGEVYRSSFVSGEIEVGHQYKKPGVYWLKVAGHSKKGFTAVESLAIEIKERLALFEIPLPSATISTPALDENDNLYLGLEDNALISFRKDGAFRFSFSTRNSVYATPIVFRDKVIFGALDSTLYCLDTTGKLLWQFSAGSEIYQPAATDGERIFFVTDDGQLFSLSLGGKLLWKKKVASEPSPVTIDEKGQIFLTADGIYSFTRDGKMLFSWQTPNEDPFLTGCQLSPDGYLLAGCEDGFLYALNKKGELLWKAATPEEDPIRCEGVFRGDTFLFGADDGVLYKKGRYGGLIPFFTTDDEIIASPVVTEDGRVFLFSDDGYLYSLREDGQLLFRKEIAYSEKGFFITPSLTLTRDGILLATSWDERIFAFPAGRVHSPHLWHTYRGVFSREGRVKTRK